MEVAANPATLDDSSNALKLALRSACRASAPRARGYLGRASEQHDVVQRCMNVVLWQSSWGYYLSNMIGFDGTGLTPDGLAWARDHFLRTCARRARLRRVPADSRTDCSR